MSLKRGAINCSKLIDRPKLSDENTAQRTLLGEPDLELQSRGAPSVKAHHRFNGPDTGRNSEGRWIIKKLYWVAITLTE